MLSEGCFEGIGYDVWVFRGLDTYAMVIQTYNPFSELASFCIYFSVGISESIDFDVVLNKTVNS